MIRLKKAIRTFYQTFRIAQMITAITFLAAMLNVPFAIACLKGLKLDTSGLKCPDDIKDVEINKKWIKGVQLTNAILFVLLTILTSI